MPRLLLRRRLQPGAVAGDGLGRGRRADAAAPGSPWSPSASSPGRGWSPRPAGTTSAGWTGCSTCWPAPASASRWPRRPPPRRRGSAWPTRRRCRSRADGVRLSHGSRDTYCASAPAYRAAARRIAAALADRYRGHPALRDVARAQRVRHHLPLRPDRRRVPGLAARAATATSTALNEAWTHGVLEPALRRLGADPAAAAPPSTCPTRPRCWTSAGSPPTSCSPRTSSSATCCAPRRPACRSPRTSSSATGCRSTTRRWAREVDLVAIDHYPSDPGPGAEEQTAFAADLARGWARHGTGRPDWLLMETAPNLIYAGGRMHAKEPGRMARHSLAAVARGSRGAMFFQWRAPRGGAELFHSALVPHAGRRTAGCTARRWPSARPWPGSPRRPAGAVAARVAIGYDEPSAWALQARRAAVDPARPPRRGAARAPGAVRRRGITTDVVGTPRRPVRRTPCWCCRRLPAHRRAGRGLADWVDARRSPGRHLPDRGRRRARPGPHRRLSRRAAGPARHTGRGVPPARPGRASVAAVRRARGSRRGARRVAPHRRARRSRRYAGGVLDGRPASPGTRRSGGAPGTSPPGWTTTPTARCSAASPTRPGRGPVQAGSAAGRGGWCAGGAGEPELAVRDEPHRRRRTCRRRRRRPAHRGHRHRLGAAPGGRRRGAPAQPVTGLSPAVPLSLVTARKR